MREPFTGVVGRTVIMTVAALAMAAISGCGSPLWETGLQDSGFVHNTTDDEVWVLVEDPDFPDSRYVTELDPGQEWPTSMCGREGIRISVYDEDPGGVTGLDEDELPIEAAMLVEQLGPTEMLCDDDDPKTVLVYDGDTLTVSGG